MARRRGGIATIVWEKDEISDRLRDLGPKLDRAIQGVMEYKAPDVQGYARANAPWTDQTGNARNGLFAEPYATGSGPGRDASGRFTRASRNHGIVLYGSVPYQIWLEVRHSGRYAIILPTIEEKGPDVMRMINKLMRKL